MSNAKQMSIEEIVEKYKNEVRPMPHQDKLVRLKDINEKRNASRVLCMPWEEELYSRITAWLSLICYHEKEEQTTERPDTYTPPNNIAI